MSVLLLETGPNLKAMNQMSGTPGYEPVSATVAQTPAPAQASVEGGWLNLWKLIEPFIRETLATYVEGGSSVALNVGFSGALQLANVNVKTAALASSLYSMPFSLRRIHVDSLKATFPVFQLLGSKHVEATLLGIVIELDWSDIGSLPTSETFVDYIKGEQVAAAKDVWDECRRLSAGQPGESALLGNEEAGSFVSRLIARLIKNAGIQASNIVVRVHLTGGDEVRIAIESLSILTSDAKFEREVFDSELNRRWYKLIRCNGLSVTIVKKAIDSADQKIHPIIDPVDLVIHVKVDNRGEKKPEEPSFCLSVVTSSLRVNLKPEQLALLISLSEAMSDHGSEMERRRRRALSQVILSDAVAIREAEITYARIAKERWAKNFIPEAPSPEQLSIEASVLPQQIQSIIWDAFHDRLELVSDKASFLKAFDAEPSRPHFRKASRFPSSKEYDVVIPDASQSPKFIFSDETGRPRVIVDECPAMRQLVLKGQQVVAINGFQVMGLPLDDQQWMIEHATFPSVLRLVKASSGSPLAFTLALPSLLLSFDDATLSPTFDKPTFLLYGLGMHYHTLASCVPIIRLSLIGLGGSLCRGGLWSGGDDPMFSLVRGAPHSFIDLLTNCQGGKDLTESKEWQSWLRAQPRGSVVSTDPLISDLELVAGPSRKKLTAHIGSLTILAESSLNSLFTWLRRFEAEVRRGTLRRKVVENASEIVPHAAISTAAVEYNEFLINMNIELLRIELPLYAKTDKEWSSLAIELKGFVIECAEPNRLSSGKISLSLIGGGVELASVPWSIPSIATSCSSACGSLSNHVSMSSVQILVHPVRCVLTENIIRNLVHAKIVVEARFPALQVLQDEDVLESADNDSFDESSDRRSGDWEEGLHNASSPRISQHTSSYGSVDLLGENSDGEEEKASDEKRDARTLTHNSSLEQNTVETGTVTAPLCASSAYKLSVVLSSFELCVIDYSVSVHEASFAVSTYPSFLARLDVSRVLFSDERLKASSIYFERWIEIVEVQRIVMAFKKGIHLSTKEQFTLHEIATVSDRIAPLIDVPRELVARPNESIRDDLHVSVSGLIVTVTKDSLFCLEQFGTRISALLPISAEPIKRPASEAPITPAPIVNNLVGSVSVTGVTITLDDMTRTSERVRMLQRQGRLTFEDVQDIDKLASVCFRVASASNLGDISARSLLMTYRARSGKSQGTIQVNYLSLLMIVNEYQAKEKQGKSYMKLTEIRSRMILEPVGIKSSISQLDMQTHAVTTLVVDMEKPFQLSLWAEELSTLTEVSVAISREDTVNEMTEAPVESSTRDNDNANAVRTSPDDQIPVKQVETKPSSRFLLRRAPSQRQVTFMDEMSSRDSFYSAVAGDDDDPANTLGLLPKQTAQDALPMAPHRVSSGEGNDLADEDHILKKRIVLFRIACKRDIALEIVKRSLSRISPDAFLPVLRLIIARVDLGLYSASGLASDFALRCTTEIKVNSYNVRVAEWEPLVESFWIEARARKIHENHICARLESTRINMNLSEVNIRLLRKLMDDFSVSMHARANSSNVVISEKASSTTPGYILHNATGEGVEMRHFFQKGCETPGKFRIEIRDIWSLPHRTRWQTEPCLEGRVIPWRDTLAIDYVPADLRSRDDPRVVLVNDIAHGEKDLTWSVRPLEFEFDYPGTSTEIPILEMLIRSTKLTSDIEQLAVDRVFIAQTELVSYIVNPQLGGISEWITLKATTGEDAEMLIKIEFMPSPAPGLSENSVPTQKPAMITVRKNRSTKLDFEEVVLVGDGEEKPNATNATTFRRSNLNTMRGASICLNIFESNFQAQLLVDETGSYALQLDKDSAAAAHKYTVLGPEVIIKSAMRPGGKRSILIESPIVIMNDTNTPLEVLITKEHIAAKSGKTNRALVEMQSMNESSVVENLVVTDWHQLPPHLAARTNFRARDGNRVLVYETPEAPLPLLPSRIRISLISGSARAISWRLLAQTAEDDAWVVIASSPHHRIWTRRSSTLDSNTLAQALSEDHPTPPHRLRGQSSSFVEGEEEKSDLDMYEIVVPVRLLDSIVRLRFECEESKAQPTPISQLQADSNRPHDVEQLNGAQPNPNRAVVVDPPRRLIAPKSLTALNKQYGRNALTRAESGGDVEPRPVRVGKTLLDAGVKFIELLPVIEKQTWKCKLCGDDNLLTEETCGLCDRPRLGAQQVRTGDASLTDVSRRSKRSRAAAALSLKKKRTADSIEGNQSEGTKTQKSNLTEDAKDEEKHVIKAGGRLPIPLRYLFVLDNPFKVYVRPDFGAMAPKSSGKLSWTPLITNIPALREDNSPRIWLRSSTIDNLVRTVLSAQIYARHVPRHVSAAAMDQDKRPNRFKVAVVPWLVIQNALPYVLLVQFYDGVAPRDTIATLAPGQERGFLDVDEQNMVQFKVVYRSETHSFSDARDRQWTTPWSTPVHPYREDSTGFSGGRADTDVTFRKRIPKRKEVIVFSDETSSGGTVGPPSSPPTSGNAADGCDVLKLVMERSNDSRASLRCVVFAPCWVYNFADVGISLKGGRSLLGSASAATRTSSESASEQSYLVPPYHNVDGSSASSSTDQVLPALVFSPNESLRISGVLGWGKQEGSVSPALESLFDNIMPGIQAMKVIRIPLIKRQMSQLTISRPRFNIKLTSSVLSCDFLFAAHGDIRLVAVEVRRPDKSPFGRSWQVIIRPSFVLVNKLRFGDILFRQASSSGSARQMMMSGLITAEREVDFGEDEGHGVDDGGRWKQGGCLRPSASPEVDAQPKSPEQRPVRGGDLYLIAGKERPYHFAYSKGSQQFMFAVHPSMSLGAQSEGVADVPVLRRPTGWSGTLALSNTEGVFCVLLRGVDGSPRESRGAVRVRCELTPRTNGTTSLTFIEDLPRSFEIENRSSFLLEVKQVQSTRNLILEANGKEAVGWDEPMKPATVAVRALILPGIARQASRRAIPLLRGFSFLSIHKHDHAVHETGDDGGASYVPVSDWFTYAMESVSELEPVLLPQENCVLRAEGLVRGSTLVLQFTQEIKGFTPRPDGGSLTQLKVAANAVTRGIGIRRGKSGPLDVGASTKPEEEPSIDKPAEDAPGEQQPAVDSGNFFVEVRVEKGKHLDACAESQSTGRLPRFHPYVVVSMSGVSKQNTPVETGDVFNPNWMADDSRGLAFALQNPPTSVHFSLLNKATDEREVLAVAREDIPKSLFLQKLQMDAKINRGDLLSEVDKTELANDGWITIGSERWKNLRALDATLDTLEREYAKSSMGAVDKFLSFHSEKRAPIESFYAKRASDLDFYEQYDQGARSQVASGECSEGFVELGQVFKEQRTRWTWWGRNQGAKGQDVNPADDTGIDSVMQMKKSRQEHSRAALKVSVRVTLISKERQSANESVKKLYSQNDETGTWKDSTTENFMRLFQEILVSIRLTSIGLSIVDVSKRHEIAYAIVQRIRFDYAGTAEGYGLDASIGNLQVDSHVQNAQFPVALFCPLRDPRTLPKWEHWRLADIPQFVSLTLVVNTSRPSVRIVERFVATFSRLNVCMEERFLGEVAAVFVRSEQDLGAPARMHSQILSLTDMASLAPDEAFMTAGDSNGPDQQNTSLRDTQMIYLAFFEVDNFKLVVNLDLEGGRDIEEADDAIAAGVRLNIPLLTIEVRDLLLKVAGIKRAGWFLSLGALRSSLIRHYAFQFFFNSGRIVTTTNWAGNPLQAGKSFAQGFYFLLREPVTGTRLNWDNPIYGFFKGVQAGSTALLANVATGISETVHGLSNTTVNAYKQLDAALEFDATTRPMAGVVELLRDVSGALAVSSREITEEVIAMRYIRPIHIRKRRMLGTDGLILEYPVGTRERLAAIKIQRAFRKHRTRKRAVVCIQNLARRFIARRRGRDRTLRLSANKTEMQSPRSLRQRESEKSKGSNKSTWLQRSRDKVRGLFYDFKREWDDVTNYQH